MHGDETHAFIIRIWPEEIDKEGNRTAWRGTIDHVGTDRRLYFQDLDGIVRFIQEEIGVKKGRQRLSLKSLLPRIGHETI